MSYMHVYIHTYVHIEDILYIYIYIYIHTHTYIYIYIEAIQCMENLKRDVVLTSTVLKHLL